MKTYTSHEIAEILSVHPMTIYREIQRGKLKAFRVGTDFRINEKDLQDYVKKNKVKPGLHEKTL